MIVGLMIAATLSAIAILGIIASLALPIRHLSLADRITKWTLWVWALSVVTLIASLVWGMWAWALS